MSYNDYEIVVGLEIHTELSTNTKAYCSCKNSFGAPVNSQSCELCTATPGVLPLMNEGTVERAVKLGLALNCEITNVSKFDRKHYFYPDLGRGYQITQDKYPICKNGYLDVIMEDRIKKVGITRIHMEEDTAKLIHDNTFSGTLIDMNRSSVPLLEIVTEPDMRSAEEAKEFLETIKQILVYLDVSDAKMQEGSIRCDVNVSVNKKGAKEFGTRIEMKNVNTFSGAVRAIEYESKRQIDVLEAGGTLSQETRRWDDAKGYNFVMRSKENALDYMYFPDPDLGTVVVTDEYIREVKQSLPELPNAKKIRYTNDYNLTSYDAGLLVDDKERAKFFEDCILIDSCSPKNIANWLLGDVIKILREKDITLSQSKLTPEKLCEMVKLIEEKTISNTAGKTVIEILIDEDKKAGDIVQEKGLGQISDTSELESIVEKVLEDNQTAIDQYKNGKTNVLGFLVGQCMKNSKGKGNPAIMKELLLKKI